MTISSLLFFVAASGNYQNTNKYALTWVPIQGETTQFRVTIKSLDPEQKFEIETHLIQKASSINTNSYEGVTQSLGSLVRLNGEEIRDNRTNETTVLYSSKGAVTQLKKGFNKPFQEVWTFAALRTFVAPNSAIEVGAGWQNEYPPFEDFEGVRMSYQLVKIESDIAYVKFKVNTLGRERPEIGSGEWKINSKSGKWISMFGHAKNIFGSGEPGVNIQLERVEN